MRVDENDFFRKATLQICSSLDFEITMWRCMKLLKDYMPADEMYMHLYDSGLRAIRTIAGATISGGTKLDSITPLPKEDIGTAFGKSFPKLLIINRPETEPGVQYMLNFYGRPDTSVICLLVEVAGNRFGYMVLLAEGKDRFTEEHGQLFSILNEPFAIALSNTLKHQETLRLKDLLADDNRYLHHELMQLHDNEIIGAEFGLKRVMDMVQQVAPLDSPVLLLGETGTGKEIIANAIHYSSTRKDGPFIKVNCGAIPDALLDSELFGHEKGAFTGALSQKRGRFERASGGTLFLDEVGELPPNAQTRMLRVLQNKEIERVGGSNPIRVDIRLIAATNRNLDEMVREKLFREDLLFRLNVFPIQIPPLKERKVDIPALVNYLIKRKSCVLKIQEPPRLAPGAIDRLIVYHWPGNVRELENVIERELILSNGRPLLFDGLPKREKEKNPIVPFENGDTIMNLDDVQSRHIQSILHATNGKIHGKGGAAELLGINPNTLRNRMNKFGIHYRKRGRA